MISERTWIYNVKDKIIKKLLFVLFLVISASSEAQEIRVHDLVVAKQGDTYYLFGTGSGISVRSSTDLKNWKREPAIFPEKPEWTNKVVPDFENHIRAPDIFYQERQGEEGAYCQIGKYIRIGQGSGT